jgi:hypothetical protein
VETWHHLLSWSCFCFCGFNSNIHISPNLHLTQKWIFSHQHLCFLMPLFNPVLWWKDTNRSDLKMSFSLSFKDKMKVLKVTGEYNFTYVWEFSEAHFERKCSQNCLRCSMQQRSHGVGWEGFWHIPPGCIVEEERKFRQGIAYTDSVVSHPNLHPGSDT